MKKVILTFVLLLMGLSGRAQFNNKLENLEMPNSPAFILMDQTVTNIQTPNSLKAFSSDIVSTILKDFKIPNNYAVTLNPYFLLTKNKTFNSYMGVLPNGNLQEVRSLFYQNLGLSFALVRNDTVQNISFGFSTNLLRFSGKFRAQQLTALRAKYAAIGIYRKANFNPLTNSFSNQAEYDGMVSDYNKSFQQFSETKSIFSVDVAGGYNHFYDNGQHKSGTFGRLGAWMTMGYNQILNAADANATGKNYYLSVYLYNRYLKDEMTYDATTKTYLSDEFYDAGGKVGLELDRVTLAYEYIKRTNNTEYRSIGSLRFKITEKIAVNGGFGKNFKKLDGNVGFFGINWGLDYGNEVD